MVTAAKNIVSETFWDKQKIYVHVQQKNENWNSESYIISFFYYQ